MDNVYVPEQEVGVWQWLFGKSITSIVLLNSGSTDGFVGIAAPSLARILPVGLQKLLYFVHFFIYYASPLQKKKTQKTMLPDCHLLVFFRRLILRCLVVNFYAR